MLLNKEINYIDCRILVDFNCSNQAKPNYKLHVFDTVTFTSLI